jgi:hypothetical protein
MEEQADFSRSWIILAGLISGFLIISFFLIFFIWQLAK